MMITAALPPALESVRQALLVPPPAYVSEFEPTLTGKAADFVADLDARTVLGSKQLNAHSQLVRAAVAGAARMAKSPTSSDDVPLAALYAAFGNLIKLTETKRHALSSNKIMFLAKMPVQARPAVKRAFKRAEKVLGDYHTDIVEAYYQLRVLDAEYDPESKLIVGRANSAQEVDNFFNSLHA